ncbi:MAG TPA: L,D-transpeptidase family protein [Sphingomicrobium sp.]|nr:L,D-transpeptidase family protein [Sphingomicrobium sp.]
MKKWILAGAACAALTAMPAPAFAAAAATNPELPAPGSSYGGAADQAVSAFYASRGGAPLWLRGGAQSNAATALMGVLQKAALDGLPSGPALALQAQSLMARASTGDTAALAQADRILSNAWVLYVETLQRPPSGMIYADNWVAPRRLTPAQILAVAAAQPSLASYVRQVSSVNPVYSELRDVAWSAMQANGGGIDPRVLTSLQRVRDMPFQKRYIIVDAAGAKLYMIDNGRIADTMRVIVGKAGASTQTPMLASTIYYATLNPYWHVGPELVRSLIARNTLDQGLGYLKSHGYQVMPADPNDDTLLDPAKVDWHAVAEGRETVRVRQLPGPANSMGHLKFGFANPDDIYLHDTPMKTAFNSDDRDLSHGCIRLEDAERLGRWLLGHDAEPTSNEPEQHALLPTPVPIYVTYLTAQVQNGQLAFVDDIYGRDAQRLAQIASMPN